MGWSYIYLAVFILLLLGILFIEKTKKCESIMCWIPVSFGITLCYQALTAGVFSAFGGKINLISLMVFNLILAIILWIRIVKNHKVQQFKFEWFELITMIVIFFVALLCWLKQFGFPPEIHYLTTDPGTHFRLALSILMTGELEPMYFASLFNAVLLFIMEPLIPFEKLYLVFIVSDLFTILLSGLLFFSLIMTSSILKKKNIKIIALIITLIYLLGYPRNNMEFGFVYLGIGVSISALILFIAKYINDEVSGILVFFMMCCLTSLGICYVLFAPVIYLGLFVYCFYDMMKNRRNRKDVWKNYILKNLALFLIPCIIVLYYSMFSLTSFSQEVSTGISTEGYIYRNLYTNFLLIGPFTLYGLICSIKRKQKMCDVFCLITLLLFIGFLGYLGMLGKVSSYYYYKNYYLLSLLTMSFGFVGMEKITEKNREFFVSYMVICALLWVNFSVGLEGKISNARNNFNAINNSAFFFNIYEFNKESLIKEPKISNATLDLYNEYYNTFGNEKCVFNGTIKDFNWFCGITGRTQLNDNVIFWEYYDPETISELIKAGLFEASEKDEANTYLKYKEHSGYGIDSNLYILILNNTYPNGWQDADYLDSVHVLYENEAGIIGRFI